MNRNNEEENSRGERRNGSQRGRQTPGKRQNHEADKFSQMQHRNEPEQTPKAMTSSSGASVLSRFQTAAINNRLKEIEDLINMGVDVNSQFSSGWTALMYASNRAHVELVTYLLHNGANPNASKDKYTAFMAACASTCTDESRILKCVCQLIDHGADVHAIDRYHMSSLMYAAREGRWTVVEKLIEKGVSLNDVDSKGNSSLMWAAQRGHRRVVHILVDASADVNLQKADGSTALDLAAANKHSQVIDILKDLTTKPLHIAESADDAHSSTGSENSSIDNVKSTNATQVTPFKTNSEPHLPTVRPSAVQSSASVSEIATGSTFPSASEKQTDKSATSSAFSQPKTPSDAVLNNVTSDSTSATKVKVDQQKEVLYCGDLELFLLGLDLKDLIPRFQSRRVNFQTFLQMNDSDLCELGISKSESRKRILDAVKETHRKQQSIRMPASSSSAAPARYSNKISCSESVAMIGNIKRHLGFIGSSVGYISDRINADKSIVRDSVDPVYVRELNSGAENALESVGKLYEDLVRFRLQLHSLSPEKTFVPEDLSSCKKASGQPTVNWKRVGLLAGGALASVGVILWFVRD